MKHLHYELAKRIDNTCLKNYLAGKGWALKHTPECMVYSIEIWENPDYPRRQITIGDERFEDHSEAVLDQVRRLANIHKVSVFVMLERVMRWTECPIAIATYDCLQQLLLDVGMWEL